jgi:hypothetical protein
VWTLAVDPGLRTCGVALFEQDTLYRAWLSRNPLRTERGPEAWESMSRAVVKDLITYAPKRGRLVKRLVLEVPQIYWGGRRGGRAADLIELAGVVGAVAAATPVLERAFYLPRQWKGQTPKDVHNRRVMKRLRDGEDARIVRPKAAALLHNVIDSIGLGMKHLGRM